jgi:hypothetical protein
MISGQAVKHLNKQWGVRSDSKRRMVSLTILQIYVRAKVHFAGHSLEYQPPFPTGRQRKLDLSVQTTRAKQRRIKGILTISSHNHLHKL